ncbi:transporter substrate-binding domain-containing protein [Glycomyces arizonensis]|uniref:transporter substrate-binding domain-containing protein n=1 Tax=Glycomyces arizonensis TaxID=256035 RepID=UPI0003FF26CB|nr:transporter substrate-binding domain-containing protein [Glycomyces arizonensis]
MNTTARRAAAALALIGTGLAAAACSSGTGGGGGENDDTLTVCTNVPFEPFEFKGDGGDIVGFDIDLMNLLAERLDQTVEIVEIDFDSIQSGAALNAGTCDIAAAGISITDEREQALGLSQPYFRADQAFVTVKGSDIASLDDLEGATVAVQSATTGESYANSIKDQYGFEVRSFETMGDIVASMNSGASQASIADLATWTQMVEVADDLQLTDSIETDEHYAFAVQKDDTELLDEVNAMLDQAFEDGTYAELYEQWFHEPYTEGDAE